MIDSLIETCPDCEHRWVGPPFTCPRCSSFATPAGSAFLRVTIETHDGRLEMDTRCGTAQYIEARAVEAIRAGCVGLLIATPNVKVSDGGGL